MNILIEDRASGTQLSQELKRDGVYAATRYDPGTMDKIMRLNSVTSTIENGFVYLPERAEWLACYLQETDHVSQRKVRRPDRFHVAGTGMGQKPKSRIRAF
jgi:predicted phage terminase large subunit-like protein